MRWVMVGVSRTHRCDEHTQDTGQAGLLVTCTIILCLNLMSGWHISNSVLIWEVSLTAFACKVLPLGLYANWRAEERRWYTCSTFMQQLFLKVTPPASSPTSTTLSFQGHVYIFEHQCSPEEKYLHEPHSNVQLTQHVNSQVENAVS